MWFALALACSSPPPGPALPEGEWVLEGGGLRGVLRVHGGACTLGLWGPALSTGGPEPQPCAAQGDPGDLALTVPFRSGSGGGEALLRWAEHDLVLPLGARPGEHELRLARRPGALGLAEREALAAAARDHRLAEEEGWARGLFLLLDGDEVVGELSLPAHAPAEIAVFDRFWLTPGVEIPSVAEHGPDLVLAFPVTPALGEESGLLRINRPLKRAVVPMGPAPVPGERTLELAFGALDEAGRAAARARAEARAEADERALTLTLAQSFAREAGAPPCPPPRPEWALALPGYRLAVEAHEGACLLVIEPDPPQHRRRLSARVGPEGPLELRFVR